MLVCLKELITPNDDIKYSLVPSNTPKGGVQTTTKLRWTSSSALSLSATLELLDLLHQSPALHSTVITFSWMPMSVASSLRMRMNTFCSKRRKVAVSKHADNVLRKNVSIPQRQ